MTTHLCLVHLKSLDMELAFLGFSLLLLMLSRSRLFHLRQLAGRHVTTTRALWLICFEMKVNALAGGGPYHLQAVRTLHR